MSALIGMKVQQVFKATGTRVTFLVSGINTVHEAVDLVIASSGAPHCEYHVWHILGPKLSGMAAREIRRLA